MATVTFTTSESRTDSSGKYWYLSDNFTFDKINAKAAEIPDGAIISKCEMSYTAKRKTGSGATSTGTFKIEFANTSTTVRSNSAGALSAGALTLHSNTSFKCNTEYTGTIDLSNYVDKSTGYISYSGATNIRFFNEFMYWAGGNDWNVSITITWTYEIKKCTVSIVISPEGAGTATGAGTYDYGTGKFTLQAYPNDGYRFVGWYRETSDEWVYSNPFGPLTTKADLAFTAVFELDKINNILVDTFKPKGIYLNAARDTVIFVVDGTVSQGESIYDTVDGIHFKVQNTVPSDATEIVAVYREKVKVYG